MWFLYLLAIASGAFLLLLFLTLPGWKRDTAPFDRTKYAHRGLHSGDGRVPENSLAAFAAAAKAGTTVTDPANRYVTEEHRAQYDVKWN